MDNPNKSNRPKRKQHITPRFYIERFRRSENFKLSKIRTGQIRDGHFPHGMKAQYVVKDTDSLNEDFVHDYFNDSVFGSKDGLPTQAVEDTLSKLEGAWGRAFEASIDRADAELPVMSCHRREIMEFMAVQMFRTPLSRILLNKGFDVVEHQLGDRLEAVPEFMENLRLDEASMLPTMMASYLWPLLIDTLAQSYNFVTVVNSTEVSFVTSDNPVVPISLRNNEFIETTSLQDLIVLALSPSVLIALFPKDSQVVKGDTYSAISSVKTVNALNYAIALGADAAIISDQRHPALEAQALSGQFSNNPSDIEVTAVGAGIDCNKAGIEIQINCGANGELSAKTRARTGDPKIYANIIRAYSLLTTELIIYDSRINGRLRDYVRQSVPSFPLRRY